MLTNKKWIPVVLVVSVVCSVHYWRNIYNPGSSGGLEQRLALLTSTVEKMRSEMQVFNKTPNVNRASGVQAVQLIQGQPHVVRSADAPPPYQVTTPLHPSVKVVASSPSSPLPYRDCVPLPRSPRPGTKICIHPVEKDVWISKSLKRGALWEYDLVSQMLNAMKSDPDIQLVDIGANIGVFTLSAAAAGYDVMAVEMMPTNVHMLQTSLQESGLSDRVTLVNNAVYSDHRTMGVKTYGDNVGGTALDFNNSTTQVSTVCMDDLVPLIKHKKVYIKMDIENAEIKALSCAYNFFQQLDVRFLQMEWRFKTKEDTDFVRDFFSQHVMKASKYATQYIPVDIQYGSVKVGNLFFVRR